METFGLELCAICHGACNPDVLPFLSRSYHGSSEPPMLVSMIDERSIRNETDPMDFQLLVLPNAEQQRS